MKLLNVERGFVQAILEAYAPPTSREGLVPHEGEVDYVNAFQLIADGSTDRARIGVRAGLWIIALAPLWLGVAFATMSGLPVEKRAAILDRMLSSNAFIVRELALLIKISAAFALMGTASVRARSNYDRRPGVAPVHIEPVIARARAEKTEKKKRTLPVAASTNTSNAGVA
jgi:hypothetical protein